jgi:hypothetical protein
MGTIESMNLGSMVQEKRYKPRSFRIVDDKVVEESDFLVNEFSRSYLTNTEPNVIAYINMRTWLKTDPGQWILKHCVEEPYVVWHQNIHLDGYTYRIIARLRTEDQLLFVLKFK